MRREIVPANSPTEEVQIGRHRLAIRPATTDRDICDAVLRKREYDRYLDPPTREDVWLDVGANLGAFALSVAPCVRWIYCAEPDPENFNLLLRNLHANECGNVSPWQLAIVGGDARSETSLYLNAHRSKASHSTVPRRGREVIQVPAYGINNAVLIHYVNKLKIDAEGVEYELLSQISDEALTQINEIVCEWHFNVLHDYDRVKYGEVLQRLHNAGFSRYRYRWSDLGRNWHTIFWFAR